MDVIIQDPQILLILEIVLKSFAITSFTFLMLFCLRKQTAALRHQICAISLLSLPLLLIASAWMPTVPIPVLPAPSTGDTQPSFVLIPDRPTIKAPIAIKEPIFRFQPNSPTSSQTQAQEISIEDTYTPSWPLIFWLVGACLLLLGLLFDIGRRNRLKRQATPASQVTWAKHIAQVCQLLRLESVVQILQSTRIQIPLTYGWRKPVVLLPQQAENWPTEQQRIVLLHEMAHIKRKDQLIQSLCHISNALYWFNPLVWVLTRRLQTEQERACDDHVINMGISAPDYATHLLSVARNLNLNPSLATVPFARKADLPNRIRLILNNRVNRKPTHIFISSATILLIGVFTLAIAPLHSAHQKPTPLIEIPKTQSKKADTSHTIFTPFGFRHTKNDTTHPPQLVNSTLGHKNIKSIARRFLGGYNTPLVRIKKSDRSFSIGYSFDIMRSIPDTANTGIHIPKPSKPSRFFSMRSSFDLTRAKSDTTSAVPSKDKNNGIQTSNQVENQEHLISTSPNNNFGITYRNNLFEPNIKKVMRAHSPNPYSFDFMPSRSDTTNTRGYIAHLSGTKYYTSMDHFQPDPDTTMGSSNLLTYPPQKTLIIRKDYARQTSQQTQNISQPPPTTWIKQDTVQNQSSTQYSLFALAVINGDLREVRRLLKQGDDPNEFIGDRDLLLLVKQGGVDPTKVMGDTSLLLIAIQNGYNVIAEELINHGAKVNFTGIYGLTPLLEASRQGNLEMVDLLLTNGAYTHAKTLSGETAFYFAVAREHIEVVKRLLKQGVDANQSLGSSYHPLYTAIQKGNKELVLLLLQHGADPTMQLKGLTPTEWATLHRQYDIVDLIVHKARQDSFQSPLTSDLPPLLKAANNGDLRQVRWLLEQGSDPNELAGGGPPILAAIKNGYHVIVQELIDHGADISLQSKHTGDTVLMWAARKGNLDLLKQAITKGADVNARSKQESSALLIAAAGQNPEIVKTLLDHSADVNIKGRYGTNPLIAAAGGGNLEIVKMLIEHGTNVRAETNLGNTALEPAITGRHVDVVRLLLQEGLDGSKPLTSGFYPLEAAASTGNNEIVELLLKHGADPNVYRGINKPFYSAMMQGHNEIAGMLLKKTEQKRGSITGIVLDRKTGQPVSSGSVIIKELGRIIPIGKSGMYYMSDMPTGRYTLQTISPGYRTRPVKGINVQEGFITTYHMKLIPDQTDNVVYGLGSLNYRYASDKGRAYVAVQYTSPKMRNIAHGENHINDLHKSTVKTLINWPASQFENGLTSARQQIKKELNAFLKDPDTGEAGVVDVYIGNYSAGN